MKRRKEREVASAASTAGTPDWPAAAEPTFSTESADFCRSPRAALGYILMAVSPRAGVWQRHSAMLKLLSSDKILRWRKLGRESLIFQPHFPIWELTKFAASALAQRNIELPCVS